MDWKAAIESEVYEGGKCVYAPLLVVVPRVGDEMVIGKDRHTVVVERVVWWWRETFGGEARQNVQIYTRKPKAKEG